MKNEFSQLAQTVVRDFNLPLGFLESIETEYGKECLEKFLIIADQSSKRSNPMDVLEEAIQKTYPEDFLIEAKHVASTKMGMRLFATTSTSSQPLFEKI